MVYQDVMRSELQPESKALYAYLASFAGNTDTCYPTLNRICNEMHMGRNRVNKYMNELLEFGVIKKRRKRNGNLLGNVVYTLTHEVSIFEKSRKEETTESRLLENEELGNEELVNEYTNNNIFNNNNINNNSINTYSASDKAKQEARELFEKVWALYPVKKGKGQVSDTQKKKLLKIGEEELTRAIDRYKEGLSRDEWRKPQNGSTFFNSGYVDYLDANYQTDDSCDDDAAAWERTRKQMDEMVGDEYFPGPF